MRQPGRVLATLGTVKQVEMFESIIRKLENQGGGSFKTTGREAPDDGRVDDATWNKMSYTQQKDYAERMSSGNGGRR
jgi:hypothetical protein